MQIKKYTQVNIAVAIILSLFITSCNSDAPVMERPEKVYYDTAQRRMKANNFFSAIESLQAIEARYPFGRYAEQAQSELIYAYYMNGEDEASHEAAEKFIRLNPRHPNIDYAYFMKGLSSYTRDNSFIVRMTDTDLSNRDISGAKESFSELTEFLTRFPDSQYATYAKQRNIYLRNMIARNELAAADYYVSVDAHIAAIRRANYVIENIPNSSENYRALKILEESYDSLGYVELLEDTRKIITLNYKDIQSQDSTDNSGWSWNFLQKSKPVSSD